ncbi:major facilitator superfamily domain-containing protein [Schizophyllum amplum]|uniref:Major facilitator superfamily domain-containing protein n=1 Tax=Schizophyllum amplum TaxID=97359 RepID=A0A550D034_9AGAR|nr:major facilitator superfamily domain-containing protein [Auriculariopsis ampla]
MSIQQADPEKVVEVKDGLDVKDGLADSDVDELDRDTGVGRAYERKCALVNQCLQKEIGFGRYQIELFMLTGLGWMADNIWLQGVAIVLSQVQQELDPVRIEFATLALYVGLIIGATTWGVLADVIGRKLSFNITLFIAGVFGIAAGGADNFVTFAALVACLGFGVGGNLPVDGALFLEHIPQSHQWTLTLLSAWWALGQLVASVVAWGFIANYSCAASIAQGECAKADNMGWRYTCYLLGALTFMMFILRFVVFDLQESSKYLIAKGRDEEALAVLKHLAKRNGREITLTLEDLQSIKGGTLHVTTKDVLKRAFSQMSLSHVKPLFAGRKLAINTSLTILLWGLIGLAYPLFNAFLPLYLGERVSSDSSTDSTYRNYTIISVLGIPGSIIACLVVDWTRTGGGSRSGGGGNSRFKIGGRKLSMALSTLLTGIFLFLFTTSTTEAAVLGFSCASGLTQNAMYGVLYAYTPEVFPAPHRGTGDAVCSAFNRVTGILAPVIKIATTSPSSGAGAATANGPIFVSASLFVVAAVVMTLLPIETAGKAAL